MHWKSVRLYVPAALNSDAFKLTASCRAPCTVTSLTPRQFLHPVSSRLIHACALAKFSPLNTRIPIRGKTLFAFHISLLLLWERKNVLFFIHSDVSWCIVFINAALFTNDVHLNACAPFESEKGSFKNRSFESCAGWTFVFYATEYQFKIRTRVRVKSTHFGHLARECITIRSKCRRELLRQSKYCIEFCCF